MFWQIALISAQLWFGEITRQRPKRTSFDDFVKNNEPSEVRPVVYAGGTIELTPTRAWYGDYKQRAVERDSHWSDYVWAGPFAGLLDFITVAYRSYVGEMFPLCYGPDAHVERITINDRLMFQATPGTDNAGGGFLIDDPQAWGGDQPPGEGGEYAFCQVTRGNYTEPPNAYLESQLTTAPNKTPALHGISTLVKLGPSGETESGYFHAGGVGVTPRLKLWKVTVRRQPDNLATGFNKIGRHMNPMEVVYEWSTSLDYGAKIPVEYLNLNNWRAVAQQLHEEGTGWSGRIESPTSPLAVVKDVLAQIDAVDEPSPSNGLTIRLIRRTYSIGSLRTLNRDNITRVVRFAPGTYEDTKNKVQVEFPDQDNNFKGRKALYIDPANQLIQDGRVVPETKTFNGVADFEQANTLTTRDGRAISLPRAPLECFVFASWGRLTYRGEVVLFEWESPSFSLVMRVLRVTPNGPEESDYHLELIEDQFSTGLRTFAEPGATEHLDPGAGLDTAPPSASWNTVDFPPDGLKLTLTLTNTNQFEPTIEGGIIFGAYAPGGQYARVYVTEPGGVQTLSPLRLIPDTNNEQIFTWPANGVGLYEFCVQTFSTRGATNEVKVCADITVGAIGSPSISPSASVSPSSSVSPSVSPSASTSPSSSLSPSSSPSASTSPSSSTSPSPGDVPSTIADMWEWWETQREIGFSDTDPQTIWTGQLQGFDMLEANTAVAPIYRTNQINSLPATRFQAGRNIKTPRGAGPGFNNRFSTDLTAAHTFFVLKVDNDPPANSLQSGLHYNTGLTGAFGETLYPFTDGNIHENWGSTTRQNCGNPATTLTQWNVYEIITTSTEYTVKLNGTQLFTTGTNTVGWPTGDAGHIGANLDPTRFMEGYIAAIYVASAKLNSTDRTTLINYINSTFGLSSG